MTAALIKITGITAFQTSVIGIFRSCTSDAFCFACFHDYSTNHRHCPAFWKTKSGGFSAAGR